MTSSNVLPTKTNDITTTETASKDVSEVKILKTMTTMEELEMKTASSVLTREISWCRHPSKSSVDDDESSELISGPHEESNDCKGHERISKGVDVESYMMAREMTPLQERMNAITMIPHPLYCLFFILSGAWISQDVLELAEAEVSDGGMIDLVDSEICLDWSFWFFSSLHAMPPLPILAVAAGATLHAPFSFIYHWKYAHSLPPGSARTNHWSRRMDQSMLHVYASLLCLGTSTNWSFFLANVAYNADCVYRQFKREVRPRRNKVRLLLSAIAWTLPIIRRGDFYNFLGIWMVLTLSSWIFAKYPFGKWSHSAFHLVSILTIPLVLSVACNLSQSQAHMRHAARCFAMAQR